MSETEPETFEPQVISWTVPAGWVLPESGVIPWELRPLIDSLAEYHFLGIMCHSFLRQSDLPYQEPDVPALHAATEAAAEPRRRRTTHQSHFERTLNWCRDKGWRTVDPFSMLRWKVLMAAEPLVGVDAGAERLHMFMQPPVAVADVLEALWRAGLRVDGFQWGTTILRTTLAHPDHVEQVRAMLQWLTNYCSVAPAVGVPPEPWRLTAARSLVERIQAYDRSPAAN